MTNHGQLLNNDPFVMLRDVHMILLGIDSAVYLQILFTQERLKTMNTEGWFYLDTQFISDRYGIEHQTQTRRLKFLKDIGLIDHDNKGNGHVRKRVKFHTQAVERIAYVSKLFTTAKAKEIEVDEKVIKNITKSKFDLIALRDYLKSVLEGVVEIEQPKVETTEPKPKKADAKKIIAGEIIETWNTMIDGTKFSKARKTDSLVKTIVARLRTFGEEEFYLMFKKVIANTALSAESWFSGLRWVTKNDDNFQKALEGWMDWKNKGTKKFAESNVDDEIAKMEREMG